MTANAANAIEPVAKPDMATEVLRHLSMPQKQLPSKYFYDQRGSELFDRICDLPEYYLTRTEIGIMEAHAADMAARIGSDALLVEYGSGSSVKIRLLLDQLTQAAPLVGYAPVDVSYEHLMAASKAIARDYPALAVYPICADFTRPFALPEVARQARRVVYFPGSTIGNFPAPAAGALLRQMAHQITGEGSAQPAGGALIGVDLQKPAAVLNAAYNDTQGVTAAFNMNVLVHLNRELGCDFDLACFRHQAFYNPERECVEMHLESLDRQKVTVAGQTFELAAGETIHTEDSHKYTLPDFAALCAQAGLHVVQTWTDPQTRFALVYLAPTTATGV